MIHVAGAIAVILIGLTTNIYTDLTTNTVTYSEIKVAPISQFQSHAGLVKTTHPIIYNDGSISFTIPKGFVTDGASVPQWQTFYLDKDDLLPAGLIHDYLYARIKEGDPIVSQEEADYIWGEIAETLEITRDKVVAVSILLPLFVKFYWDAEDITEYDQFILKSIEGHK